VDLSLTRKILTLTLPVALTRQMENLVGFADIYMVGRLGPEAISAVGISRVVIMVIVVMMIAVSTGTFAMVAQATGAGDRRHASATAKQSFTLIAALSAIISLIGFAASPWLLTALSVAPEVVALGAPYLRVFFGGIVFMTVNFGITTCLQGAGDTRTPFYIGIIINLVKIAVSYLLIFGAWGFPKMGVTGAAVGTMVGRAFGVIIGFCVLYSGRFVITLLPGTTYRPNLELARRILRIGIPSALQGLFRNGSGVIYVKFVALTSASTTAVAAYSIGSQIERTLRTTSLAFGTVATALVGQSLGAKEPDEAERRGWTTMLIAVLGICVIGVPVAFFARPILGFFTDATDVVAVGIIYLFAMVAAEPFMCTAITAGGGLRGAGDTMPGLYYTVISQWLVRLPVAYLLAFTLGYDIVGIWAALIIFSAMQGILTAAKFARGEWKSLVI